MCRRLIPKVQPVYVPEIQYCVYTSSTAPCINNAQSTQPDLAAVDVFDGGFAEEEVDIVVDFVGRHEVRV